MCAGCEDLTIDQIVHKSVCVTLSSLPMLHEVMGHQCCSFVCKVLFVMFGSALHTQVHS